MGGDPLLLNWFYVDFPDDPCQVRIVRGNSLTPHVVVNHNDLLPISDLTAQVLIYLKIPRFFLLSFSEVFEDEGFPSALRSCS